MSLNNPIRKPSQMRHPLVCEKPSDEWLKGLAENQTWWFQSREEVNPANDLERAAMEKMFLLRDKLLSFGGYLTCLPLTEPDFDAIMERGELLYGKGIRFRKGRPSQCHRNSAALWDTNRGKCQIMTGYALSKDGCWRQHTWCAQPLATKWRIWETTEPRVAYFGVVLNDTECECFFEENF